MSKIKDLIESTAQTIRHLVLEPSKSRPLAQFAAKNIKIAQVVQGYKPQFKGRQDEACSHPSSQPQIKNPFIEQKRIDQLNDFATLKSISLNTALQHEGASSTHSYFTQPPFEEEFHASLLNYLREPIISSQISLENQTDVDFGSTKSYEFAIKEALSLVDPEIDSIDPLKLVGSELFSLAGNITKLLETGNPYLSKVARYYFQSTGKQIRPLVVLLLSQTINHMVKTSSSDPRSTFDYSLIDQSVPKDLESDRLSSFRNSLICRAMEASNNIDMYQPRTNDLGLTVLPTQKRLAEITELIHTASLVHDDIIDNSETRRGKPTTHQVFGNKMAVLAGDFLLARASISLARLRNPEVVELLATVIMDLVEGELKQLKNTETDKQGAKSTYSPTEDTFSYYLLKTYMKTSSLFANSARATAILAGASDQVAEIAYLFGRNLGNAFQLVDDLLDFTVTEAQAGKPVGADLKLGIATAPVLYAWQQFPELGKLVERRFSEPGDTKITWDLVHKSDGIAKTRKLVVEYAQKAMCALCLLPPSPSRQALLQLTHSLIYRKM